MAKCMIRLHSRFASCIGSFPRSKCPNSKLLTNLLHIPQTNDRPFPAKLHLSSHSSWLIKLISQSAVRKDIWVQLQIRVETQPRSSLAQQPCLDEISRRLYTTKDSKVEHQDSSLQQSPIPLDMANIVDYDATQHSVDSVTVFQADRAEVRCN